MPFNGATGSNCYIKSHHQLPMTGHWSPYRDHLEAKKKSKKKMSGAYAIQHSATGGNRNNRSRHQLPMTGHWGPYRDHLVEGRKKIRYTKDGGDYKQEWWTTFSHTSHASQLKTNKAQQTPPTTQKLLTDTAQGGWILFLLTIDIGATITFGFRAW